MRTPKGSHGFWYEPVPENLYESERFSIDSQAHRGSDRYFMNLALKNVVVTENSDGERFAGVSLGTGVEGSGYTRDDISELITALTWARDHGSFVAPPQMESDDDKEEPDAGLEF